MKALCLRALPPSRAQVKLSSAASVRSTPHSRHCDGSPGVRLRAISGLMRRSKFYSITSSARRSNEVGTLRPSALAVFMLITSWNLVGCSTGRSEGFAPLRILST